MLAGTKEKAAAFLDDVQYLRGLLINPNRSLGDLRRASSVLRRLLIESDIMAVAAPRIGRILFSAPTNRHYDLGKQRAAIFFACGGIKVFGIEFKHIIADHTVSGGADNYRPELSGGLNPVPS
jgi:hypothetical protein